MSNAGETGSPYLTALRAQRLLGVAAFRLAPAAAAGLMAGSHLHSAGHGMLVFVSGPAREPGARPRALSGPPDAARRRSPARLRAGPRRGPRAGDLRPRRASPKPASALIAAGDRRLGRDGLRRLEQGPLRVLAPGPRRRDRLGRAGPRAARGASQRRHPRLLGGRLDRRRRPHDRARRRRPPPPRLPRAGSRGGLEPLDRPPRPRQRAGDEATSPATPASRSSSGSPPAASICRSA